MNAKTVSMLRKLLSLMKKHKIDTAIGGGVAINIHGYARETSDVDAFFMPENRHKVLQVMRKAGFVVDDAMSPFLYFAFPPRSTDPLARIDLMFPVGDPEESAIQMAAVRKKWGLEIPVFPAELLAICKFQSEREKDQHDFDRMYELGLFDVVEARRLLAQMEDEEPISLFDRRIEELKKK